MPLFLKSKKAGYVFLFFLSLAMVLAFQNCGNVSLLGQQSAPVVEVPPVVVEDPVEDPPLVVEGDPPAGAGPGAYDPCAFTEGDMSLVKPQGFTRIAKSFTEAFGSYRYGVRQNGTWRIFELDEPVLPTYPNSTGFPTPIGAPVTGYMTIEIEPGPTTSVTIFHDRVQVNAFYGYIQPRVANGIHMTLSTCPGDFRKAMQGATDQLLKPACRGVLGAGLSYSALESARNSESACFVEAGKKYYINISTTDFETGGSVCPRNEEGVLLFNSCEVHMVHRGL